VVVRCGQSKLLTADLAANRWRSRRSVVLNSQIANIESGLQAFHFETSVSNLLVWVELSIVIDARAVLR
jgi:hypothetical protein